MKIYLKLTAISLALLSFTSCCQQKLSCNRWTEKDCYYSDYYQTPPTFTPDCNYYHSDSPR